MAKAKRARVTDYDFTYPGTVAFYEGMDTEYLRALYFRKVAAINDTHDYLLTHRVDPEQFAWAHKKCEQIERECLSIQQILNARQQVK